MNAKNAESENVNSNPTAGEACDCPSDDRGGCESAQNERPGRGYLIPGLIVVGVLVVGILFVLHAKGGKKSGPGQAGGAVPVVVKTVSVQNLPLWTQFSARMKAVNSADIRPEVSGRITDIKFKDGQSVKAGDVLLVIDPTPFEAAVARAEARIAVAQANLQFARSEQARSEQLLPTHAIAQREFDQSGSLKASAEAELLAAQAELKTAQVDLGYANVKAPISGRTSRAELTIGNVVQSGPNAPMLTSIVSEDGIYADFEVDEQTYLSSIRNNANGNVEESKIEVELILPYDVHRTVTGTIQNFDNRLDTVTGTIRARARFDNTDGILVPGMFVTVRLASSRRQDLIIIPDRAVGFDQSKRFVFVVGAENKVAYRELVLGADFGNESVVLKGLSPDDRVIVEGLQRVGPGAVVAPEEVKPALVTQSENKENAK
jgi:multidrug efflux system membrane fusion protein